jgi:long-chain acyl-CoA synthetase
VRRETLVDFFLDLAEQKGEFLVYDDGYRSRTFSYVETIAMAWAFASRLRENGIGKGEKVILWSENRPGWLAAFWGAVVEGVVVVPIDYRASADFLQRVEKIVSARAVVIGDEVTYSDPSAWSMREIEDARASPLTAAPITRDDVVEIVFTSGATAEPKGVVITHANLLANLVPVEREIEKYRKYGKPFFPLRFVNLLPLSHLFGQAMAATIPPLVSGVVVFLKTYNPEEIFRQVRRRRVSVIVSVPKLLELLRDHVVAHFPEVAQPTPPGMRWWARWWRFRRVHRLTGWKFWAFVVGAAPLPPELEEFWSRLGYVVIQGYGLTETAPIVTLNHPFHTRKGTVGTPIAGVEVRIAPDGEILVRGGNVSAGYFNDPAANRESFEDGWFHTGDIGEVDSEGRLSIRGRKKDMIVTPEGLNVFPEDVERVLDAVPGVRESAVVGPDRVEAVIVLDPGADSREIIRQANAKLEEHQKIRGIREWPGLRLPRTEGTQKLKRGEIRNWLKGGEARAEVPELGVLGILRRYAPGRKITSETTLDELGLSSLDRVQLLMELEQQPGGAIGESAFTGARTVGDLMTGRPEPAPTAPPKFPAWSRLAPVRALRRVFQPAVIFPLTRYYARTAARGLENLTNAAGPVVFAANHQSHMDTPAIVAALPKHFRYRVAPAMSKEFFKAHFHPEGYSLYRRFISSLQYYLAVLAFNAFPIPQRELGVSHTMRYIGELVAEGWSILIFPEGVRAGEGDLRRFQPGVAMIASRLGVPVVPVRIRGLHDVLDPNAKWATRGQVTISFGAPMRMDGNDYSAQAAQIEEAVKAL